MDRDAIVTRADVDFPDGALEGVGDEDGARVPDQGSSAIQELGIGDPGDEPHGRGGRSHTDGPDAKGARDGGAFIGEVAGGDGEDVGARFRDAEDAVDAGEGWEEGGVYG